MCEGSEERKCVEHSETVGMPVLKVEEQSSLL